MSATPSLDETILATLADRALHSTAGLAARLGTGDRSIRHRLRRLIRGGYIFSPFHGGYRITAAGLAAIAPLNTPRRLRDSTPADLLDRWRRGRS